jgi:hypothetical protein
MDEAMPKEVTRSIGSKVERELWARAAGRCQFDGCNRILYKSPVTQESVNISEKAHVYSFSENGPRGWRPFTWNREALNDVGNLMLVCHDCHKKIDQVKDGGRYQAELLLQWKLEHEKRIAIVTGVDPSKKSYVVLYGANIGEEKSLLQPEHAKWALFPEWYPAEERAACLDMTWEGRDDRPDYWVTEESNLRQRFDRLIRPLIEEGHHFSIFGFAPIPLLIRLGVLFTDKIPARVYQLHREPEQTWQWSNGETDTHFQINMPSDYEHPPALIIALSSNVARERVTSILGSSVSVWELTISDPNNDFLKTPDQLSKFRETVRKLMVQISQKHGNKTPLSIFPAMPVATAIELGRIRMPKAEMPWIIYDQNNHAGAFVEALRIGEKII